MPRIHFLVLDQRALSQNIELQNEIIDQVKSLMCDLLLLRLASKGSEAKDLISIITCGASAAKVRILSSTQSDYSSTNSTKVVLQPQRVTNISEALKSITPMAAEAVPTGVPKSDVMTTALELVLPFLEALRKRQTVGRPEPTITKVSVLITEVTLVPLRSPHFQKVISRLNDEHNVAIEFVVVDTDTLAVPAPSTDASFQSYANLMEFAREAENCSFTKVSFGIRLHSTSL
jgi:hypothetical protein